MFSLLAASGDAGAAFAPWLAGMVAQGVSAVSGDQAGLRMAMLITAVSPLTMLAVISVIKKEHKKSGTQEKAVSYTHLDVYKRQAYRPLPHVFPAEAGPGSWRDIRWYAPM